MRRLGLEVRWGFVTGGAERRLALLGTALALLGRVSSFPSDVDYPNKRTGNLDGSFVNLFFGQAFFWVRIKSGRMLATCLESSRMPLMYVLRSSRCRPSNSFSELLGVEIKPLVFLSSKSCA